LHSTEGYRLEVFEAHDGGVSQRKLELTHRIGSATIERWYQHQIRQRISELSNRVCPRVMGIDEHFFTRKKGYATTLVDLQNHKVFDVVLGRSEPSLRSYLGHLPGKDQVRVVVMDLSQTSAAWCASTSPTLKSWLTASMWCAWSTTTSSNCGKTMTPSDAKTGAC
jgi:transposase